MTIIESFPTLTINQNDRIKSTTFTHLCDEMCQLEHSSRHAISIRIELQPNKTPVNDRNENPQKIKYFNIRK